MPFVMKKPQGPSKGIVIFTHKERLFTIGDAPMGSLAAALARLRERYVIGMHWGHYADDVPALEWVDFHLAAPGTVRFRHPERVRHIPLASRNFLGREFRDLGLPRTWDIINIARPIRLKRLDEFLRAIRKIYDRGTRLRVLLVCPCPDEMREGDGWYASIYDDYTRLFTEAERADFLLLMLRRDGYPFPLASGAVADLLNRAKIFALFSEQEGESRAVAEALVCGLVVVCRWGIRGGADDYLDDTNSRRFTTLDEASDALVEAASSWSERRFDSKTFELAFHEEHSRSRLFEALKDVFADLRTPFEGELDLLNLDRQLPSHVLTLPAELRNPITNDLASARATLTWIGMELGRPAKRRDLWRLAWREHLASTRVGIRTVRTRGRRRAWTMVRRIQRR
ncbi:MAG: glycosyltransferase [Gaiellaceae bacterium]